MKTSVYLMLYFLFLWSTSYSQGRVHFIKNKLTSESKEGVAKFLYEQYPDWKEKEIKLEMNYLKKGLSSVHYTFDTRYKDIAIRNASVKVSTNGMGEVVAVSFESDAIDRIAEQDVKVALKEWENVNLAKWLEENVSSAGEIQHQELKWDLMGDRIQLLAELKTWSKSHDQTYYFNSRGELHSFYNHARYANKKDTLISARVFKPDPLTRLGLTYGGANQDNGDADQLWLAMAYDTVQVLATWDSSAGKFLLENKWAIVEEFESPIFDPASSVNSTFFYNRSQSGFEDCNALYHITNFQEHIQSLGYDTLMDLQLQVETHGQFGADNSVFMRNGGSPTVSFGTGGVDDAEDADVVVHEYSHGISWSANNNDNFTSERSALDEGVADYFATSYSRVMNPFNWQNVFNWDGPIWGGRVANTNLNYPATGSIYAIGEIWNAALSNIWNDLGPIVTDKLMLETLHFFTNSTTLPQAAEYMLKADTLLFGGVNFYQLCANFSNKGILQGGCAPANVAGIDWANKVRIHNSLEFARSESDLIIEFPEETTGGLQLYAVDGKLIKKIEWNHKTQVVLSRSGISAGSYFLSLNTDKGALNLQVAKWMQ